MARLQFHRMANNHSRITKNKTWILNKTGKIGIYNILLVAEKMQQEKEKRNENHKFLQHYLYASPENNIHKLT